MSTQPRPVTVGAVSLLALATVALVVVVITLRQSPPDEGPSPPSGPLPASTRLTPAPAAASLRQQPPRFVPEEPPGLPPDVIPSFFTRTPDDRLADDLDALPRVTWRPEAVLPPGIEPTTTDVRVVLRVDRSGDVTEALALEGQDPALAAAATENALQWRFEPATSAGEPVPFVLFATVTLR